MPPKIKISDGEIIDAALLITRERGWEAVNAREIAKRLRCSTQPIFRAFTNMSELKKTLYTKVLAIYDNHMLEGMKQSNSYLGMGLAYIDFAKNERNLFKLLFMSDSINAASVFDMLGNDDKEIIEMVAKMTGLSYKGAMRLYVEIWLITHGIAAMFAANSCGFSDEEIQSILKDAFFGITNQIKTNEEKQ